MLVTDRAPALKLQPTARPPHRPSLGGGFSTSQPGGERDRIGYRRPGGRSPPDGQRGGAQANRALPKGGPGAVEAPGAEHPRPHKRRGRGTPATAACLRAGFCWVAGRAGGSFNQLLYSRRSPCSDGHGFAKSPVRGQRIEGGLQRPSDRLQGKSCNDFSVEIVFI